LNETIVGMFIRGLCQENSEIVVNLQKYFKERS